jgi:hypothetical protein
VCTECAAELLFDINLGTLGLIHPVVLNPLSEDWKWDVRSGNS